jgi:hypothetical protein
VEPAHDSGDQRLRATKKRRYAGWSTGHRVRIRVATTAVFVKEAAKFYTLFCGLWKDVSLPRVARPLTLSPDLLVILAQVIIDAQLYCRTGSLNWMRELPDDNVFASGVR